LSIQKLFLLFDFYFTSKIVWKKKLGNYPVNISKYFLTGVFVTSLIKDLEGMRWLIYAISGTVSIILEAV